MTFRERCFLEFWDLSSDDIRPPVGWVMKGMILDTQLYRGSFQKLIVRIPSHGPGFDLCSDVFVF